jgi:hypothetical protein
MSSLKRWGIIIIFGFLLCIIYAFGSFTLDYYAGAATLRFGVMGPVSGIGMFFIYILGFYIALVVVLPILIIKRFGVGVAVYLPYAIAGLFVEYYMEWVTTRALVSIWAVVGWCVIGLVTGFSADLAYWLLPSRFSERLRAITTGVVLVLVTFALVLVALTFFYVERQTGPGSFLGIAYYGLPLLILNGAFGGYAAYAISRHV